MQRYFSEVIREFRNIRWLRFSRALVLTFVVIIASLVVGFSLGLLDNGFQYILSSFI